jgi:preprotein translocase subunit SecG
VIYVLYAIHVVVSLFLILVVLLQQGKGADLSVFGGGATQAAFGARGSVNVLHRLTVACFVLFILTTLSIGLLKSRGNPSVMRGLDAEESTEAPPAPALAPEPAPGAAPSAATPGVTTETPAAQAPAGDAEANETTTAEPPPAPAEEPPPGGNG